MNFHVPHPYDAYPPVLDGSVRDWIVYFGRPLANGEPPQEESVPLLDGNPSGCTCPPSCESPCWQRVGIDDGPCPSRCGCSYCTDGEYDVRNDR